jgi:hypothetical protein
MRDVQSVCQFVWFCGILVLKCLSFLEEKALTESYDVGEFESTPSELSTLPLVIPILVPKAKALSVLHPLTYFASSQSPRVRDGNLNSPPYVHCASSLSWRLFER